ncbi:hypothetical protein [Paracandidimonas soli]|uniref:SdpI/YhfL family protein n=1 Tax=Paracandidimonas soli TaxID=1917182 RepID=A0A4R3UW73_9BURK|nr:hypothetical protein [Paracandidimonas soli]TCU95231.1 hypothetical protein EV686_10874 [Paracandidimonas soli]
MIGLAPYVNLVLTWILFLALFPISFIWMRRSWRILVRRDMSEVALKRGEPAPRPQKYAAVCGVLNLLSGLVLLYVIAGVAWGSLAYDTWTALAGITIWTKLCLDFAISRQAHGFSSGAKRSA